MMVKGKADKEEVEAIVMVMAKCLKEMTLKMMQKMKIKTNSQVEAVEEEAGE